MEDKHRTSTVDGKTGSLCAVGEAKPAECTVGGVDCVESNILVLLLFNILMSPPAAVISAFLTLVALVHGGPDPTILLNDGTRFPYISLGGG